jgi:hypothetical protein
MTDKDLEARLADMQDQLNHLFGQLGPARWEHILRQRAQNAPQPKPPFSRNQAFGEVHRPKDHER